MDTQRAVTTMDAIRIYRQFLQKLDTRISKGPFKVEYICNYLNLSRSTLYKKRKNNSFTLQEAEKLAALFDSHSVA